MFKPILMRRSFFVALLLAAFAVTASLVDCRSIIRAAAASRAGLPQQQQQSPPQNTAQPQGTPTPQPTPEADDEVISIESNLTNILMTAVDRNQRFITSLRQTDLRVFEDNAPQTITIFQRETDLPLSLAILIDTSASQEKVLPDEKSAARTFVDAVLRPAKDRTAIVSFTGEVRLEQNLTNDTATIRSAIERVKLGLSPQNQMLTEMGQPPVDFEQDPTGYTNLWDATWSTVKEVLSKTPEQTRRAIILLTDGDDTHSGISRKEATNFAIKNNVVVYSIGIRDKNFKYGKLEAGTLRDISEKTGGRAFFPKDASELPQAFAQIEQELRAQYLVAYSPTNKRHDGQFRQVRLEIVNPELRKQKLRLLYRQGYYARSNASMPPTTTSSAPARQ